MGRQLEAINNHFSHQHPLHLTNNPYPSQICSACKQTLQTDQQFYTCKIPSCTTYSLHLKCSQLPYKITHPCHQQHHNHPLSLLAKPQNPNGFFACNACGKHGDGFSYNCKDCNVSVHVMCATLPLSLSHSSHCHQLNLVFSSPYGTNVFSCDVCGVNGGYSWLYTCKACGFDAHLSCATSNKPQVVTGVPRSIVPPENLFLNQFNNQKDQYLQAIMGGVASSSNANNQILQAMMGGGGGVSNQIPQAMMGGGGGASNQILQAMMGGGGGASNQILQAMMGGGGGGGASNQILQAMMGGGGGGDNPLMQAFMGGGGAGGGDLMQSLLNGSGGGGMDLSSILGNGCDFGGLMGAGLGGFGFF